MISHELIPNLDREQVLWSSGCRVVAGIDEAGRGALAGPVVAAAVVIPQNQMLSGVWSEVRDSKLLAPLEREDLENRIQTSAMSWAVGSAAPTEIDDIGIANATKLAMCRAIERLIAKPDHLLIDWVELPELSIPQTCWAKADQCCASVAAASILAKVHRDRTMCQLDGQFPLYGFAQHKGYGTPQHRNAINVQGPCVEHRYSFAPVAQWRSLLNTLDGAESETTHE